MQCVKGKLIVLEGLDATGKSTQLKLMQKLEWVAPVPIFTHQPSGSSQVGKKVYRMTEQDVMHPATRQLLHLAAHAEHYDSMILPALEERAVFMDRCWWSTVAYGYFGGDLSKWAGYEEFCQTAQLPAQGVTPDMIFLFNKPYASDPHNTDKVEQGYGMLASSLASQNPMKLAVVPAGDEQFVHEWIVERLVDRHLIELSDQELQAKQESSTAAATEVTA